MRDQTSALVAEHYKNFGEMSDIELVMHLIEREKREVDIAHEERENLLECAWTCYAKHLGLEYFRGNLMQFGDGGYPYLYVVPAEGGDTLCHRCATGALQGGESVGWCHHMEGAVEYCDNCGSEIRPFVLTPPKKHRVVLELESYDDPAEFDWSELLDLGDGESCRLLSSEVQGG